MACFIENMIQVAEDEDRLFESMLKINFRKAEVGVYMMLPTFSFVKSLCYKYLPSTLFNEKSVFFINSLIVAFVSKLK